MSTEANKEIARRWNEEFFNQRKIDAFDRFFHPNYVQHPGGSLDTTDFATAREQFTQGLAEAPPDLHLQIEDLIAEGDKVAFRWTAHQGGKAIAGGISIYRIEDGKIIEDWFYNAEVPQA